MKHIPKFTAAQRKAIYGAVAAIATLSVAFGVVSAAELTMTVNSVVDLLTAIGGLAATALALANITPDGEQ